MLWQYKSYNAAGQSISLIPIEDISKTAKQWRKVEHHWLGQADAELQICPLLLQKNYIDKFSTQKVEQIMFNPN